MGCDSRVVNMQQYQGFVPAVAEREGFEPSMSYQPILP